MEYLRQTYHFKLALLPYDAMEGHTGSCVGADNRVVWAEEHYRVLAIVTDQLLQQINGSSPMPRLKRPSAALPLLVLPQILGKIFEGRRGPSRGWRPKHVLGRVGPIEISDKDGVCDLQAIQGICGFSSPDSLLPST